MSTNTVSVDGAEIKHSVDGTEKFKMEFDTTSAAGKTMNFTGAMKLKANIKWLVTGTPIQNAKSDFYSLLLILGLKPAIYANPSQIKNIIRHFVLKRTKKNVGIKIPPVKEHIIYVNWESNSESDLSLCDR